MCVYSYLFVGYLFGFPTWVLEKFHLFLCLVDHPIFVSNSIGGVTELDKICRDLRLSYLPHSFLITRLYWISKGLILFSIWIGWISLRLFWCVKQGLYLWRLGWEESQKWLAMISELIWAIFFMESRHLQKAYSPSEWSEIFQMFLRKCKVCPLIGR